MSARFGWFVVASVLAGAFALALTPAGGARPGHLAAAGSDVPVWALALIGVVVVAGVVLLVLGLLRRRRGAESPAERVDTDAE